MTDPFSILTGAIAILGAALRTCQVTEDFIKGIKGAPEAVAKLYGDVTSLLQVLKTLEALLNKRESLQNAALLKFLPNLRLPLDHCMKALADVDCALKPYVKTLGSKGGSKWRVSSTAFLFKYREKDIESLQRGLLSTQSMLDSAVQVVHLYVRILKWDPIAYHHEGRFPANDW